MLSLVYIACNDSGAGFIHANANRITIREVLSPYSDVPDCCKEFFAMDRTVSYDGHFKPILTVQVTELLDGLFIGCAVNHAVVDGTSLWNFFNTFAEVCRGADGIMKLPDFSRSSPLISPVVLRVPPGAPMVTFSGDAPLRERIFSFSRESILKLKNKINHSAAHGDLNAVDILGKQANDTWKFNQDDDNGRITSFINDLLHKVKVTKTIKEPAAEISSFQSLCALLWRAVTRARRFPSSKTTTFRMAVNVRHRLQPKMEAYYFGNAIQSIPTYATAGEVEENGIAWCAGRLSASVKSHDDGMVRKYVSEWEENPRCFPLGNFDGGMITMGSSPRFPMYDNDFGWGRPMAVRSGRANKFDGKISAFPGREGGGSADLEVVLAPETMAALEADEEFMKYVKVSHRF
uniref:BAHD acyltransferase n=1 Tax=Kalanchoe fedtschenkoi TaxID=63787 RepID=A0A7N0T6S0_KALFE